MKKNPIFFTFAFVALLTVVLGACRPKHPQTEAPAATSPADSATRAAASAPDSTLYGTSEEFGMSTFTLVTDQGDTLSVMRDHEDGQPAAIYGDLAYDTRYAMTTCDDGESLLTLINIEQLNRFVKDYKLWNGHLVLSPSSAPDTAVILTLSDKELTYRSHDGKTHRLQPTR